MSDFYESSSRSGSTLFPVTTNKVQSNKKQTTGIINNIFIYKELLYLAVWKTTNIFTLENIK